MVPTMTPTAPVVAREHKLAPVVAPPPPKQPACRGFPWLTIAGFAYLTLSSGMALHRSRGDPGAVAFVAFSYADLVALFCCLWAYERAEPGSAVRDWLKLAVWLLTAALTVSFSYKVSTVMPPPAAALVWLVGLATVAGGFVAFFCVQTQREMAVGKALDTRTSQQGSPSPPPSFLTLDVKRISGATRWPPPSLDLSSLSAHTSIEPRACGVISP